MLTPKQCYFRSASSTQEVHSKLFTFIDFGSPANQFLSACGTKHEPTVEEIAQILLENPRNFYQISQGRDKYVVALLPHGYMADMIAVIATCSNCGTLQ